MTVPLDVAIVGAGISGVYAGWRLMTAGGRRAVTVFEASDRVGGRLLSVEPPGMDGMVAELGGMRILPAAQPRIAALLEALGPGEGIETYPFPADTGDILCLPGGVHLRLRYFPPRGETVPRRPGEAVDGIVTGALERIVPGITARGLTHHQRRRMARDGSFGGAPLHRQGFWQVLLRAVGGEAGRRGVEAGGCASTLREWNAADAIPWFLSDPGVHPEYAGFRRGFQRVPLALAERFRAAGGVVETGRRLLGFEVAADAGSVTLRFAEGDPVTARSLVLAMPRRALDLVTPGSVLLRDPDVAALVRSVTPRPLFKLFTAYASPWWLPGEAERPALLMATYDDGPDVLFQDGFRSGGGAGWPAGGEGERDAERFIGRSARAADGEELAWHRYAAPRALVAELRRGLATVDGLPAAPEAREAAFHDWGRDPYGGGWNSWNVGVRSWEVIPRIVQPDRGAPVYVCGEAYSDGQGWVEGALQTADLVLRRLGVDPLLPAGADG